MDKEQMSVFSEAAGERQRYSALTPAVIEELLSFPALLTCQSTRYGKADPIRNAYVGLLNEVRQYSYDIELQCQLLFPFPQQKLDDLAAPLDIRGARHFSELNHCHWSLKEVDLLTVINGAGLNPLTLFGYPQGTHNP